MAAADSDRLAPLCPAGLGLLDGGFATHLEDALGHDISSSPLWSAALLDSQQGSAAIAQTHDDFLRAGANVVSTSTYQASALAFAMAGQTSQRADELLIKSVQLAHDAREGFYRSSSQGTTAPLPLLLLSLGPFGAALSNGVEYTGEYYMPDLSSSSRPRTGPPVSPEDLEAFHYNRLATIASSSAWAHVDLLAFETIPRLDEAIAIRRALQRIFSSHARKPAYASFVFPQGRRLPWPSRDDGPGAEEDMQQLLEEVVGDHGQGGPLPFDGVGINCTKPRYLGQLVERMTAALPAVRRKQSKPYLFLYPDGGLVWDGQARVWKEDNGGTSSLAWPDQVMAAARASQTSPVWAGCFVGGCCKATTADIAALRARIDAAARGAADMMV